MARLLLVLAVLFVSSYAGNIRRHVSRSSECTVGKDNANIKDVPYQLSLEMFDIHFCGASIISAEWAITSAQCLFIFSEYPEYFALRAGSSKILKGGSLHQVAEIVVHPNFDWDDNLEYDIALLRIVDKFDIGQSDVQVVALADEESQAEDECTVSGWGKHSYDDNEPNHLQKVQMPIVDRNICKEQYKNENEITERMICAGFKDDRKVEYQGDSGGPLVSNGHLVGMASRGIECEYSSYANVFTSVVAFRDWIKSVSGV